MTEATAIIITYNSAADIGGLLELLPAAVGTDDLRVLVVDNSSTDCTAAVVARFPDVEWVPTGTNLGYAGGINVGRELTKDGSAVVILNPDIRPEPGSIGVLLEALERDGVGAAVPRIVDADGNPYPSLRREPTVLRAAADGLLGTHWPGRPGALSEMVWDQEPYTRAGDVEWATGAVLAVSAEANRAVGDWDDARFFLYSEETDYSRRLREAGFAIRYEPDAVVSHRGGGSGSSRALVALNAVNRVRYYRKYHSRPASALFRLVVIGGETLRVRRPASRTALRALLRKRRWTELPGRRPA